SGVCAARSSGLTGSEPGPGEMARGDMLGVACGGGQCRILLDTDWSLRDRAPRMEAATARHPDRAGWVADDRDGRRGAPGNELRHGVEQALRVRVLLAREELGGWSAAGDATEILQRHEITGVPPHDHILRVQE